MGVVLRPIANLKPKNYEEVFTVCNSFLFTDLFNHAYPQLRILQCWGYCFNAVVCLILALFGHYNRQSRQEIHRKSKTQEVDAVGDGRCSCLFDSGAFYYFGHFFTHIKVPKNDR